MENNYEMKYNKFSKFDKDVMSNLFFQLGVDHNRLFQFEKLKNDFKRNNYSARKKLNINYSYSNNKLLSRNKIIRDASYVFTESKKNPEQRDSYVNLRNLMNVENDNEEFFPTQIKQVKKPRINLIRKKSYKNKIIEEENNHLNTDNDVEYLYEKPDSDYYTPKCNHNQIIYLQGKNNRTYLYKVIKNKMEMDKYTYNVINKLDLTESVPILYNNKDDQDLRDFALMERVKKLRKPYFKI
jgi:hypothetical protein